jgi:hypothetical protein
MTLKEMVEKEVEGFEEAFVVDKEDFGLPTQEVIVTAGEMRSFLTAALKRIGKAGVEAGRVEKRQQQAVISYERDIERYGFNSAITASEERAREWLRE